jgi:hypothetical protein
MLLQSHAVRTAPTGAAVGPLFVLAARLRCLVATAICGAATPRPGGGR